MNSILNNLWQHCPTTIPNNFKPNPNRLQFQIPQTTQKKPGSSSSVPIRSFHIFMKCEVREASTRVPFNDGLAPTRLGQQWFQFVPGGTPQIVSNTHQSARTLIVSGVSALEQSFSGGPTSPGRFWTLINIKLSRAAD